MMRRSKSGFLCLALCVVLGQGCASVHPSPYARTDRNGSIAVYRVGGFNAGGVAAVVKLDAVNVVKLGTKEYVEIAAPPGTHEIGVFGDFMARQSTQCVEVQTGEKEYLRVHPNPTRLLSFLCPPIDILCVRTFLLTPSTERDFKAIINTYHQVQVEYLDPSNQPDAGDGK